MNIGARLKEVRKKEGYRLKDAADAAGVDIKLYQAYEAGRARTPVNVLLSLSEFYGYYSVDTLLGLKPGISKGTTPFMQKYLALSRDYRKIVDYILHLKN